MSLSNGAYFIPIHEIFREPTAEFVRIAIFWIHLHNDYSTHLFQLHVEKQDATKWPNQPVLQAVHSCFAMFNIRIVKIGFFGDFTTTLSSLTSTRFFELTRPLPASKYQSRRGFATPPPDPSITVFYPETRKTRTKISQD